MSMCLAVLITIPNIIIVKVIGKRQCVSVVMKLFSLCGMCISLLCVEWRPKSKVRRTSFSWPMNVCLVVIDEHI